MPQSLGLEDYRSVFQALSAPCLLLDLDLDLDLRIVDANRAYLRELGRDRHDLVGRPVFEAFPDVREGVSGATLAASMRTALTSGLPDELPLLTYDVEVTPSSGDWQSGGGASSTPPVLRPDGSVAVSSTPCRT